MTKKGLVQVALFVAVLMLGFAFANVASAQPVSQHVTLTGYVSCVTCLQPNACHAQTRLGCTQWWTSQGSAYVLVVGDTHYRLSGMDKELLKAAAENSVTVTGDFDGFAVAVTGVDIAHATK
jgi:hypothetical protein